MSPSLAVPSAAASAPEAAVQLTATVAADAGLALTEPKTTATASDVTKANRQTRGLPTRTQHKLERIMPVSLRT